MKYLLLFLFVPDCRGKFGAAGGDGAGSQAAGSLRVDSHASSGVSRLAGCLTAVYLAAARHRLAQSVQQLLGHSDVRMTEIYTHFATAMRGKIRWMICGVRGSSFLVDSPLLRGGGEAACVTGFAAFPAR